MLQGDDSTGGAKSAVPGEGVLVKKAEVRGLVRKGEGTVAKRKKPPTPCRYWEDGR